MESKTVVDILGILLGTSGLVYFIVQWYTKRVDHKTNKREKDESEVVRMLRDENIARGNEILELKKLVTDLQTNVTKLEIEVQKYRDLTSLTLDIVSHLKSLTEDDRKVVDVILNRLKRTA